jgi:hypothetical protein
MTRLDLVLQKHPDNEAGIRLLASRDPSGNLKYLDWGARMLVSGQALAPEIADILDLFHRFSGRGQIRSDIYAYRPRGLAGLRETLLKIKRATDRKRKRRERIYRIEGTVEADVIYDSPDLIVRHIKNKQASAHYGLGTKWCISMLRQRYFDDYEAHNATFFFFERKTLAGDEFDKVALMMSRNGDESAAAFTSIDRQVDVMMLAKAYGPCVFDIFRKVYEYSDRYPGSAMSRVYAGTATQQQLESALAAVAKLTTTYERNTLLESICCNDAAPLPLLEEILRRASKGRRPEELVRIVMAAMVLHPAVPADLRENLVKSLRRRHVTISQIRRDKQLNGQVGVSYRDPHLHRRRQKKKARRKKS